MAGKSLAGPTTSRARLDQMIRVESATFLAASLVHDLSQPLSAINAWAATCRMHAEKDAMTDERLGQQLALLADEAERATRTLRGFKELSSSAGHLFAAVDLHGVLAELVALIDEEAAASDAAVRFAAEEETCRVVTDPGLVQMVAYILCRNSLDALRQGPRSRREIVVRAGTAGTKARVLVEDTGPGIDAAVLPRLFTPFATSKPYGVGLGLALCQRTVEALGGRIWLQAQSEDGTTFAFELPREPVNIGV